jgi:hypothetical protein
MRDGPDERYHVCRIGRAQGNGLRGGGGEPTLADAAVNSEDAPKAVLHSAATALPLSTRLGHWWPIFAVMHNTPLI